MMITLQSLHVWLDEAYVPATLHIDTQTGRIQDICRGVDPQKENALDTLDTWILPGFIDCHTHTAMDGPGGDRIGDTNDPRHFVTPFFRAIDATDYLSDYYADAAAAGVTQVCVMPGPACVVGGQVGVITTYGSNPFTRIVRTNAGMKAALGMRPKIAANAVQQSPQTKMAVYSMLREAIIDAKRAQESDEPQRDLGLEGWLPVLEKRAPLRLHCHRADDLLKAIALAEEMQIPLVVEHATAALPYADELVARGIAVVSTDTIFRVPQVLEEREATEHLAADLMKKGVKVALSTNFPEVSWEALQVQVGECLREGVPYATVIDSLTKVPAQILGLDEEAGCLEAGRWADLSVWSAEYGSFNNRCIKTMVRGEWAQKGAGK